MELVLSGVSRVGNSGYLLDMYSSTEEWKERLERDLEGVDSGIAPSRRGNSYYVKVIDPGFYGEKVLLVRFSSGDGDCVVIDMKNRNLLRRTIEQPFSAERWGALPSVKRW